MWDFDLAAGSATRAGNVASTSSFYLKNDFPQAEKYLPSGSGGILTFAALSND